MQLNVDVQIACDGDGIPTEDDICNWIEATLQQSGRSPDGRVDLAVRVVGTEEIRRLNGLYREQDKPTNVLSFPAGEIDGLPDDEARSLGDIVICAAVVADEASEQGKVLADHWCHMLVHGALHLLGFDHANDAETIEMEGLETVILASQNVTDPYAGS
ncbi:MAG: rRNA maturation RNase YbeY [Gammaproteobacteria bacterium]|nr:rRNA maturation RNase YbeY [Gammaproteobacteria bacterium]